MDIFYAIAELLAGLGAFLLGFKLLSDGMSKLANRGLKRLFAKTTDKPLVGVGVGAMSTAILQASGIVTVMVVGFVNANIMNLTQAAAVIMGSNIGTTITAQIAALQSIDIMKPLMLLTFVGAAMALFGKKDKVKTLGLALGGLGLVFIGMQFMQGSMDIFKESGVVTTALQSINNPFLLLLLGVLATAIVQSSSAITSIVISMAAAGLVIGNGGNSVLYVILGTNIGTCVTALISAIGASANAKRASLIHLMFNVFGAMFFMILLLCWRGFYEQTFVKWFAGLPGTQIAMFHTFFNVVCAMLFVPFIKVFVKLSTLLVKDKVAAKQTGFIDERLLKTPSIALAQINKEAKVMADHAFGNLSLAFDGFIELESDHFEKVNSITDEVEKLGNRMVDYLVKISAKSISIAEEETVNNMHHNINDILRINSFADNIVKYTEKSINENLVFSDDVKKQLAEMFTNIKELYTYSIKALFKADREIIRKVDEIEEKIDLNKKQLIEGHICRLNQGVCQPDSSGVFINLVSNLERAADHLTFIAHSTQK